MATFDELMTAAGVGLREVADHADVTQGVVRAWRDHEKERVRTLAWLKQRAALAGVSDRVQGTAADMLAQIEHFERAFEQAPNAVAPREQLAGAMGMARKAVVGLLGLDTQPDDLELMKLLRELAKPVEAPARRSSPKPPAGQLSEFAKRVIEELGAADLTRQELCERLDQKPVFVGNSLKGLAAKGLVVQVDGERWHRTEKADEAAA